MLIETFMIYYLIEIRKCNLNSKMDMCYNKLIIIIIIIIIFLGQEDIGMTWE